ncbi:MAG TPA: hypothetical protein VGC92_02335 [Phenylobacterium sp.]|jgi:hypothetical protein
MRSVLVPALIATGLLAAASPAPAQVTEPWRTPTDEPVANRARVTSSPDAAKASPAEQRQAKALAVAVFAKPAAAKKAADKVAADNAPAIPPAEPNPDWVAKDGVGFGGKGVQVKTPF